jgi:hypothetical protein
VGEGAVKSEFQNPKSEGNTKKEKAKGAVERLNRRDRP